MRKSLIISILCLIAIPAFAANDLITCEVKGQGESRSKAIENAIVLAVGKLYGVDVNTGQESFRFDTTHLDSGRHSFDLNDVSIRSQGTRQNLSLDGLIKSFDIISESKLGDGTYEVALRVTAYDYKSYENKDRIRIAIMPFKASGCSDVEKMLNQKVTEQLSQTNKFALLDRNELDEFKHEMDIIKSDDSAIAEKSKKKRVLGADYMLVGSIDESRFEVANKTVAITGHTSKEYRVRFAFSFKVIESPTRMTKYSDEIKVNLRDYEVKALFEKWDPVKTELRDVVDKVLDDVATQIAQKVTEQFYPARVLAVNERMVVVNSASWMEKDMVLSVLKAGQEIVDYDTKEKLGQLETKVAKVKIVDILPKIAYAKIVQGDIDAISRGDICRALSITDLPDDKTDCQKTDVVITDNGGVVLPFDK